MSTVTADRPKLMRFRLKQGRHQVGHIEQRDKVTGELLRSNTIKDYSAKRTVRLKDPKTGDFTGATELVAPAGYEKDCDIIETTIDLIAHFGGTKRLAHYKFERLEDPQQPSFEEVDEQEQEGDELELVGMTVNELRDFADVNEIDLGAHTKKADIVRAIQLAIEASS